MCQTYMLEGQAAGRELRLQNALLGHDGRIGWRAYALMNNAASRRVSAHPAAAADPLGGSSSSSSSSSSSFVRPRLQACNSVTSRLVELPDLLRLDAARTRAASSRRASQ